MKIVEKIEINNPSHGAIADALVESLIDLIGFYTGGFVSTANAKKLAKAIEKNPKIIENYTAHSQGSLILGNALNLVVKNGKAEVLKGKKIHMNGSPGSMKVMEEFAKEHGIEFTYKVNVSDEVTYLGKNSANTSNRKHTGNGNDATKGYNRYQEWNSENKRYETNVEKDGENEKNENVKYKKEDVHLINDIYRTKNKNIGRFQ